MSTIYRALWSDADAADPDAVLEHSRRAFATWVVADAEMELDGDGEWTYEIAGPNPGERAVALRSVGLPAARGFEGTVVDRPTAGTSASTEWSVSVAVVADAHGVHTLVELGLETDNPAQRIKVGRPRVVAELLAGPGRHTLGSTPVVAEPVAVGAAEAEALAAVLRHGERALPYIVFTEPLDASTRWLETAARTAHRAAGVAVVVTLDRAATRAFRGALADLAVWGGAVRRYDIAPLESAEDGWRHRYVTADHLAKSASSVIDGLVYAVAGVSTRRRIPDVFGVFADAAELEAANRLAAREDEWAFELELEREERREAEQELAAARGHLDRLSHSLRDRGLDEVFWESHDPSDDAMPNEARDLSEAVLAARTYLRQWLTIPEGADRELEILDSTPNGYAWGNTTLRGLRALAAYAEACSRDFEGNFWQWCERGEPLSWPATTKKLAMRESETVANNERFARARVFPIDQAVSSTGQQYMESHLKISEGGGNLAPRVYFHDDTDGPTGRVHVGFVGPHYLVPNTRS